MHAKLGLYQNSYIKATEMYFPTEKVMNIWDCKKNLKKKQQPNSVPKNSDTTRSLLNKIRKRQATILSPVMRRDKPEHLVTT